MSRTVRRKNYVPYWVGTDWERIDGIFQRVKLEGKALQLELTKYHSDWGSGAYWVKNAPAWFRRDKERLKRAKDRAEERRLLKQGDYEEYSFTPRRKDVGWDWW